MHSLGMLTLFIKKKKRNGERERGRGRQGQGQGRAPVQPRDAKPHSMELHTWRHRHRHAAAEKQKMERRRSKWDGRGSHRQRKGVQSQPHGITAALPCLHMQSETARRGREEVGVSVRCVLQITRCAWCAWCAPTIPITLSLSQLHANGM